MKRETNKTFKIVTLGCRTNQYESQAYHDQLMGLGFAPVREGENASLCIVNTCTVTESADSHSRHAIRNLTRHHPGAKVVVTGCLAERLPDAVKNIEGVDQVVPNTQKERLIESIFPDEEVPEFAIKQFDAHTRAFIKVQDGCNSFCTYCIIPYVRGRSRSRTVADVVREAEELVGNGYKEIVLTGINIGDFDGNRPDGEKSDTLAELVRAVDAVPGLERLRVSSIDPDEVDDNLLEAIIYGRTTCPSMHIVLQSGSNVTLKRMNRKYTRQMFMETIDRLRQASPDFTFTTDVIVGFPGETDADFEETLAVMREAQFAKVHLFPYSERARTRAATYPNKVPPEVMRIRKQEVLRLAEQLAYELRSKYVGRRMTVLTESLDAKGEKSISGHTANFLNVNIATASCRPNELVLVDLVGNTPEGLTARLVEAI